MMSSEEREPFARLMRGLDEVEAALESMQAEACGDGLLPDRQRLVGSLQRIGRLLEAARTAAEPGRSAAGAGTVHRRLIGNGPAMQAILATIARIGGRESHVLVQGESGTGKELVARAIHDAGPRAAGRFIAVDCGALADSLLESELFGHRKGAFTGALVDRMGLLEEADGGTLFLDELANASPAFQTRLLRVLQECEVRRVGENQVRRLSLRVIAATSGNLRRLMSGGEFRQDLYYRLNVLSLDLAPLRQRREDIPLLLDHFLERCCSRHGLPARQFHPAAREILMRYDWPGNIRELANVVERAALLSPGGRIQPDSLPGPLLDALLQSPAGGDAQPSGDKNGEQRLIERALLECRGDRSRAARSIGWPRGKLYRRLRQYGIPGSFGRERD
jgi:DNA-binding NtrC family response regulator